MATFTKIQDFSEQVCRAVHNFGSHTFRLALCSTAPVATNTILSDLTQISYTNISGGVAPSCPVTISETTGTTTIAANQVVITATGTVPSFRYYVLYNDTATNKNLCCFWDHGTAISLGSGETLTIRFDNQASAGTILTLA